jgi:hypothetical protein
MVSDEDAHAAVNVNVDLFSVNTSTVLCNIRLRSFSVGAWHDAAIADRFLACFLGALLVLCAFG